MFNEPDNTGEIQVLRDEGGRFIEGISGNIKGKPPGSKNYLTQLEQALKEYETEKGITLFKRLIERAFINDQVMLSVVKKFILDKQQKEVEPPEDVHILCTMTKTTNIKRRINNGMVTFYDFSACDLGFWN